MTLAHLDEVVAIERACYQTPWARASFVFELRENPCSHNLVMRSGGRVVAYACVWVIDDEIKINNVTVHPEVAGRGLGTYLLSSLLAWARERGCRRATLEVRPSNLRARRLYARHGFRETGRRKNYYREEHEDAIVMAAEIPGTPHRGRRTGGR